MTSKSTNDLTTPLPIAPHDESRRELFDRWARSYDASVVASAGFPFAGYDDVLDRIVSISGAGPGLTVLDLGTGTGALAARFVEAGCDVIGLDFSRPMLDTARAKVPGATFVEASLTADSLPDLGRRFDRIVSAYTFHELTPARRLILIQHLFETHLDRGGAIVIGDISFPSAAELEQVRSLLGPHWDEREFYLVAADEVTALESAGVLVHYEPVSFCAGVFALRRR